MLCVSLGLRRDNAVPAIVVVHPSAEHLWESIPSIVGVGFDYLVEKGNISRSATSASDLQTHQIWPMNGSSIGNISYENRWGSLGGYLTFSRVSGSEAVAITCAHTLIHQGEEPQTPTICVQPSVQHLRMSPNLQICLGGLGTRTGCGCSSSTHCTYFGRVGPMKIGTTIRQLGAEPVEISMDWVILQQLRRIAQHNKVHDRVVQGWERVEFRTNEDGEILVGNDQRVYMQGALSGRTTGCLQSRLAYCHLEGNSTCTRETWVLGDGENQRFSGRGDSGSWVVDNRGFVIGVLLGGYDGTTPVSLITPMQHLLEDICEKLQIDLNEVGVTGWTSDT